MVFESVVADVLNRFLGDYVENLDGSQLKLGIWGGDVVLKDLRLKDSALQDLDLPIKTVSGYLGKLVLKIPWKNLYTAPVVVLVERLHLLAVPSQGVAYSREKEDAIARDLRKQQLSRHERRQQLADTSEKLKEKDDTFVEKLVTQIIKNVQVTVKDIHIRYEDQVTAPDTPFALGITLHTLCLESTDNHWKPAIVTDAVKQIYKMVSLDSLSVYWNSRTQLFGQLSEEERERRFLSEIATSDAAPPGAKYILGPINATAQLKLNPKPEHDGSGYQIPKVWLNLVLKQLAIGVTKYQYRDMIELLQSMERMTLAQPYRKYRPALTEYSGHAAQWWRFAYKCVLNEMVRRRRRNWSWVHMKSYRDMCRRYAKAYKTKLTTKKVPQDVLARIDDYEFKLDIVNVIMIRQKVQLEVDRQLEREKKERKEAGWFGGWFGGGSKMDTTAEEDDIAKQFEAAMTADERQKLYAAIDYQENAAPAEYPAEFEAVQLAFRLGALSVSVEDEEATPSAVLQLRLSSVDASLAQRPAAAALRLEASISELRVDGVPDGERTPAIATTRPGSTAAALLTAMFETNPLDGECDQRLRMRSQPVEMVYHAETFGRLAAVFRPPRHVQLSQLQAAAISKLHELKDTSALKMQYAIETHKSLDLEIDLMASQLVVPEFGDVTRAGRRLALNLGSVRLRSAPRQVDPVSVREMASQGTSSEDIFNTMAAQAYDQFDIDLEDIEVVVSVEGESWREALKLSGSPQHLVRPITLSVCVKKCLITDDPRLPIVKVDAAISKLSFSVSDYRLIQLATLASSIPSAAADDEELPAAPLLDGNANMLALDRSAPASLKGPSEKRQQSDDQITDLLLSFSILELCVDVYRRESAENQSMADEMISLMIGGVGCTVAVRSHTLEVTSTLAGVTLKSHEFQDPDGGQLYLVSTPMTQGRSEPLLSCKYTKVDRGWDKFRSEFGGVAQLVELSFSELTVQLHQAALCSLMAFGDALSRQLSSLAADQPAAAAVTAAAAPEKRAAARRHPGSGAAGGDVIDVRLDASFSDFRVQLSSSRVWVAGLDMANLQLGAELRPGRTQLTASLSQFSVTDLTPDILRDKVLSMTSDEVFRAELHLYDRPAEPIPASFVDLELAAQLGGARLLFTNRFVTDVLAFLQPFSATQAALAEASQTAAEAAQLAMQNAYAQAFKAKLDITMKAPVIVVPQNSSSDWALVADLGNLSVKNSLEMPGSKSAHGAPAVLDVMTLKLDNLQFSRGRLGSDGDVMEECLVLKPVTMSVQVTRNLSVSWYKEQPEVDILAKLGDLAVELSEQDYAQIMLTLTENLSEPGTAGLDALPPSAAGLTEPAAASTAVVPLETTADVSPATPAPAAAAPAPATGQDGEVFTKLKFSFDWTFVGIELFVSSAAEKEVKECKSSRWSLGTFGLHQLAVTGQMQSDGALHCRVSLEDCVLQDTRADTDTCFPKLMEKVTRSGKPKARMIDVRYSQKANQDRDLQARVSSVSLILFLPYLMMLMEFFTKNLPEQKPDKRPARPPPVAAKTTAGKPQRPTTLEAPRRSSGGAGTAAGGLLTLQLTVDRPDIALVEDLSDVNTRAVVFDNEIQLKVQQTPEKTNVMGDISKIQLFTCIYNPAEREATMNEIVSPFSVSVMGSVSQAGDTRLQLEVTDVKLHVNAAAIHLLTSISSGLTSAPARPEDPAAAQPAWTQLWHTRDVHSFNFWFLQPETADEATQDSGSQAPVPATGAARSAHREELIFKARSLSVTVEQVVGARNVPLVLLDAAFEAQIKDWSAKLLVESSLKLELAYYNSLLAAWEPIIECVERRGAGMVSFSPWQLHMKVERNEDHTEITSPLSPASVSSDNGAELVNFQPPVLSIHISTKDPLEVTVTRTCLDVLTELQESLANALELTAPVADETDAHFLIRNQLDVQAVVYTNGEYTVHGSDVEEVVLDQGAEVPLMARDLTSVQLSASSSNSADNRTVRVKVPSLDWTADIPVTRAESRFFRVQQRRAESGGDSRGLLADIRAHFDSKIVTLRSCVQVENHQTVPVKVYYMNSGGNELQCVGVAEPHGVLALPLSAVYSNTAELFFGVEGYTVSVQPFVWRELQNTAEVTRTLKCDSKKGQAGHALCMLCHGEMKPVFFESSRAKTLASRSYRIHLRPPAVLSNLLPVELTYLRPGDLEPVVLPPGGSCQMSTAQAGDRVTLQLASYLDRRWACSHQLTEPTDGQDGLTVWTFISGDGDHQADLSLGMHTRSVTGSLQMALYAPFWMINRTGKMLTYKTVGEASSLIYHPETFSVDPVLFSFKPSSFFSKKKAAVRVEDSEWSDKFSLDTVGSGGTVTCASHNSDYGPSAPGSTSSGSTSSLLRSGAAPRPRRSSRLEVVGSGASVSSASSVSFWRRPGSRRRRDLTISVQIQLSRSGLTRQVYFLPSVVVANNAPYDVQVHEPAAEEDWITVPANTCSPFWPRDRSKELRCRVAGTTEETTYLSYKTTNDCLLYLKNKYGGISTSVQVDEASTIITLDDYVDGMATVRIINHTSSDDVAYRQRPFEQRRGRARDPAVVPALLRSSLQASSLDSLDWGVHEAGRRLLTGGGRQSSGALIRQEMGRVLQRNAAPPPTGVLKPGEVRLYTWERPTSERTLAWSCGDVKDRLDPLVKDGIEEFKSKDGSPLYWVSFLDGMQRTLMFTADLAVAMEAHNAVELERIDQEVTIEIEGVGLSLVNNITQTDVMYLGITSSGVVWEAQKARGKRFRALTSSQCALLEHAHQTYETKRLVGANPPSRLVLDNKMEVNFETMQMLQPNRRHLRRTFQSGLWLQLRASTHQRQLHAKLNRLQLDNQLRGPVFPVVLAPVPPPKSIAADSVPKAFVEMSVVERLAEHTTVQQFKYCKMLIQEFHVKLDQGFIAALVDVFSVDKLNRDTKELVENDLEVAREELKQKVAIRSLQEQRNFFDFLHFSPLKIHVSFSMTGGGGSGSSGGAPPMTSGFVQLLLQSVGVTLTEIQDVVFKLAYFQREHQFLSQTELTSEVTAHYTGQAVKQLYVLVLGLDVIGNPFGLVVGLRDGVSDLFYEPVQGAIQGPGEFAEGLALGVTSLFSHAVGGTAGAVSRITGTLGKGIAALTLDQDYQQKRREALNRRPADFTSGIAQSGRGLVMGVVDGVTGVVKKPIEGAQEEGALGFVKGMGKGMVGLFTRPTSGVVDFASGSFDAVKRWRRQTDLKFVKKINRTMDQDEVTRLRPSRHFQADRIIRPYVRHEAEGAKTLLELEKGRYASTDTYVAHAICRPDRRVVFLLTDHRVLLLSRNEIFGNWQVDWTYMWKELTGPPRVTDKGLELRMPTTKRGFSLFGGSDGVKLVPITDHASAQWMRNKIEETMRQYNVQ